MPSANTFHFGLLPRPCWMGIVNVTPNSFSDGGQFLDPAAAAAQARALAAEGAALVDLGAEASSFFRPNVEPVAPAEQLRRLLPVLADLRDLPGAFLSIDTRSATVARETLAAGAHIINDISAGTHDAAMLHAVAESHAGIILMHLGPEFPRTPAADDPDIVSRVRTFLGARLAAARVAGIPRDKIAIDPGVGFGKTMRDNWRLALRAHELLDLEAPVVLGASRKRFLETQLPADAASPAAWQALLGRLGSLLEDRKWKLDNPRDAATAALTAIALRRSVPVHRVHNVALARFAATDAVSELARSL